MCTRYIISIQNLNKKSLINKLLCSYYNNKITTTNFGNDSDIDN